MISSSLLREAETLLGLYRARSLRIATAESCTGGLIAATLTAIAGSSDVVERGFVTYSNAAKTEMLGVAAELIAAHGAVSQPVAEAMATGALIRSTADRAVAVTGIAGPGGGSATKPVGLVWIGLASRDKVTGEITARTEAHVFPGDRHDVRAATVARAIAWLREAAPA